MSHVDVCDENPFYTDGFQVQEQLKSSKRKEINIQQQEDVLKILRRSNQESEKL